MTKARASIPLDGAPDELWSEAALDGLIGSSANGWTVTAWRLTPDGPVLDLEGELPDGFGPYFLRGFSNRALAYRHTPKFWWYGVCMMAMITLLAAAVEATEPEHKTTATVVVLILVCMYLINALKDL